MLDYLVSPMLIMDKVREPGYINPELKDVREAFDLLRFHLTAVPDFGSFWSCARLGCDHRYSCSSPDSS
jgi:hypothetical protein